MAAELQPPEGPITITTTAATTAAIQLDQLEDAGPLASVPKRQRRPSVRLGEIGDQPAATLSYDSNVRRTKHHPWRFPKDFSSKSAKARSLTNLVDGSHNYDIQEAEAVTNTQNGDLNLEFGHRRKGKRGTTKRMRSNWISKVDERAEGESREDGGDGFRDFGPDSDSPLKDQSPVHSIDNVAHDLWHHGVHKRMGVGRSRVSDSRENDARELDNNLRESDSRDRKCGTSSEGVSSWLIELGLSRYAPVFEIHEVDDEVLPLLTLEDLKDMGINAVGSRRKLFSAIQKLRKGYS